MENIILYSTGCPKCKALERKLNNKGINFEIVNDIEEMKLLGFDYLPIIKVENELLDFKQAIDWVNRKA